MFVYSMLQVLFSFCAGVIVGTEYNMKPHIDKAKDFLSQFERRKPQEDETLRPPSPPPPAQPKGWFSWSQGPSTGDIKKE